MTCAGMPRGISSSARICSSVNCIRDPSAWADELCFARAIALSRPSRHGQSSWPQLPTLLFTRPDTKMMAVSFETNLMNPRAARSSAHDRRVTKRQALQACQSSPFHPDRVRDGPNRLAPVEQSVFFCVSLRSKDNAHG